MGCPGAACFGVPAVRKRLLRLYRILFSSYPPIPNFALLLLSSFSIYALKLCVSTRFLVVSSLLEAVKSNAPLIKHDLSQRVKLQLRKVPNLAFYIDDSLDYIEKIDNALSGKENPITNPDLLEKRKKS